MIEDRVSIYTREVIIVEPRPTRETRQGGSLTPEGANRRPVTVRPQPEALIVFDPCLSLGNPTCIHYPHESPRLFSHRHRPPLLVQPQLVPGTIAGNVNAGMGYVAGQSAQAPPIVPPRAARPIPRGGSFTDRGTPK